jgi:hypothetical protein
MLGKHSVCVCVCLLELEEEKDREGRDRKRRDRFSVGWGLLHAHRIYFWNPFPSASTQGDCAG